MIQCDQSLFPHIQVMAYEACRDVMEALRAKYSGPLQASEVIYSLCRLF